MVGFKPVQAAERLGIDRDGLLVLLGGGHQLPQRTESPHPAGKAVTQLAELVTRLVDPFEAAEQCAQCQACIPRFGNIRWHAPVGRERRLVRGKLLLDLPGEKTRREEVRLQEQRNLHVRDGTRIELLREQEAGTVKECFGDAKGHGFTTQAANRPVVAGRTLSTRCRRAGKADQAARKSQFRPLPERQYRAAQRPAPLQPGPHSIGVIDLPGRREMGQRRERRPVRRGFFLDRCAVAPAGCFLLAAVIENAARVVIEERDEHATFQHAVDLLEGRVRRPLGPGGPGPQHRDQEPVEAARGAHLVQQRFRGGQVVPADRIGELQENRQSPGAGSGRDRFSNQLNGRPDLAVGDEGLDGIGDHCGLLVAPDQGMEVGGSGCIVPGLRSLLGCEVSTERRRRLQAISLRPGRPARSQDNRGADGSDNADDHETVASRPSVHGAFCHTS